MKNIYNTENHHNSKQGCYENVVKFCCILRLLNRDEIENNNVYKQLCYQSSKKISAY